MNCGALNYRQRQKKMRNRGFTLVEILIAFTISLLLILLIFSGFRLSSRSYEKILEQDEISQRIRVLNERLGWLIRGIYAYKIMDKEGNERSFFVGNSDSIGFVTSSVLPETERLQDLSGLKWVYLFVDAEGLKEKDSIYFIEENLGGSLEDAIILENSVESMKIEYLDPEENTWVEEWNKEKDYIPSAVRIRLRFLAHNKNVESPDMVFSIRAGGI